MRRRLPSQKSGRAPPPPNTAPLAQPYATRSILDRLTGTPAAKTYPLVMDATTTHADRQGIGTLPTWPARNSTGHVRQFVDEVDYRHPGDWRDREGNSNVEPDLLCEWLRKQGYSECIHRADARAVGIPARGIRRSPVPPLGVRVLGIGEGIGYSAPTTAVPYAFLPQWLHESIADPRVGLRDDHPDASSFGPYSLLRHRAQFDGRLRLAGVPHGG